MQKTDKLGYIDGWLERVIEIERQNRRQALLDAVLDAARVAVDPDTIPDTEWSFGLLEPLRCALEAYDAE